jgi:hypothetical protein
MAATEETCSWCGRPVDAGDGLRLAEPAGDRGAAFCRLEHVVPWALRGPTWSPGVPSEPPDALAAAAACAQCGEPLPDTRVVLVRHRGAHRIPDAFCSVDHLAAWARAGGRYAP